MRAFLTFIIIVSAMAGWFGTEVANAAGVKTVPDVSWPNCNVELPKSASGIVGVTGGLALRPNPCLVKEASNFNNLSVYMNTGYPGPKVAHQFQVYPRKCLPNDRQCQAYNYGYNNGLYAIRYTLMHAVIAKTWWLDVETENSWDNDTKVNRSSLSGSLDAIEAFAGHGNVGFYSYPGQWDLLTGKWRNNYPAWVATGSSLFSDAASACQGPSFSGGPIKLSQYTPSLDESIVCK